MDKPLAIGLIIEKHEEATRHHKPFGSPHEGFAVMREKMDKLWEIVKKKPHPRKDELLQREAVKVAAMALKFLVDVV